MNPFLTRLEFWLKGTEVLSQSIIVPSGSPIPAIGDIVLLPSENEQEPCRYRCDALVHQYNLFHKEEVDGVMCNLFVVRILVSKFN